MKTAKRILALLGATLLIGLYISTLIFALLDNPVSLDLLKISVAATIFLPVLLYAVLLTVRLTNRDGEESEDES